MVQELKSGDSFARAAERVRAKRKAERVSGVAEQLPPVVTTTTSQVRARLNYEPDDATLGNLIQQALTALSRGIRWARGSIVNLIV